jgi:ribosomal protein S18 acetylase RimI-like enzyme
MMQASRVKASTQDLADANLLEAIREHARWQEPCERVEEGGVMMVAGPNAFPIAFRNCVVRIDREVAAAEVLERAQNFFASRGRGFTVLVRGSRDKDIDEALRAAGFSPTADSPCMLIDSPVAEPSVPAGVRIERFSEEAHVQHALQINEEAYQAIKLPAHETRVFFGRRHALLSSRIVGFVAYRDAVPVSTALTILGGEGAGVYWVGTASHAQRSGLAEVCTRLATNAGFANGASVVTLQASAYGEPLYQRLGYRTYDRLLRFRYPEPARAQQPA